MDFNFDKSGFAYIWKIAAVTALVIFSAQFAASELGAMAFVQESGTFGSLPAVGASGNKPREPVYQKLTGTEAILANGEGVLAKKNELLAEGRDFVFADLGEMRITVYRGASPSHGFGPLRHSSSEASEASTTTFDILSKGRDGSFFETPSGIYTIGYKEKNHFSSIGKVWMPWSMYIFGNYFIHGWPYYPNGRPVEASFSGGCIRLSVADAGKLFALVKEGMPVLIYAAGAPLPAGSEGASKLTEAYFKKVDPAKTAKTPKLSASAYLAADFETGQVLLAKNADSVYSIASVTKLMTALVAAESFQARSLKINKTELATYGSSGGFVVGEIFSSDKLLYPMLLASSNDAASVFENEGWRFIDMMNQKAKAIGMELTHYKDASGLAQENVSTANNLFTLLKYIYSNKKPIFDILALPKYTASSDNQKKQHTWINMNWPAADDRLISGKSGYTDEARETFAGVFKVKMSEDGGRKIAIIVLHSEAREGDINAIIRHLEDTIVYGNVLVENGAKTVPKVYFNEANVFEALGRSPSVVDLRARPYVKIK
ncbi:MAG: L,D-transpeptidase family protein [bacterium]|nr:L,D-transpeptidase family protein [bacterium]